ncbi:glutathione S-transferase C-terminal domain-containing protein isoform X2 [Dasypus novemcinctus]|uniref:glutathione S-transferase C-terminal domain-containing protein isoform X2 n=1 Tax=Dasypus novemcinctus TaxID=9361 RepID=UPI00062AA3F1|nr:glutathione S-transferase C-terminal domain-containing protein isoform X2 [Dasypus novemcinctus]
MTAGPSNYEEALCAISLPAPGRRVVCQPLFARAASESRLRRGGKALAIRVTDTYTHPPCLAAPLRPGKEGARAAELPAPKALQPLLEASGSSGLRMRVKGGKGDGVELVSGSSPALQLPRVLWTQLSKVTREKKKMKRIKKSLPEEYLYLDFSHQTEGCIFPLHTFVTIFLLSYCDCKTFKVCLVLARESIDISLIRSVLSQDVEIQIISREELPPVIQNCRLPATVERPDNFCRAGLAVVLRHIIQKSYEADTSKKEILELLGFKKTCLKACAEVSQWTRLCELTIPLAIENFLRESSEQPPTIPVEIRQLEKKLSEPVRVHNDDKLRRQKLKQQKAAGVGLSLAKEKTKNKVHKLETSEDLTSEPNSLELEVAFSKLTIQEEPATTNREPSHIRKAKTSDLPPLEHVFAEGLYFTLADIVLLPCIHHFLENGIEVMFSPHPCPTWTVDWNNLPAAVSPKEGKMSSDRALRKQQQLNNLVYVVTNQAKPGDRIVDFCSGGGHVGIVLAHMLPLCQVILIENKELSLVHAKKRSEKLGLSNIWFIQANMEYFTGNFNIGVALHACGVATDMVIEHCIKTRASFVTCPCCYGFIQNTSKCNFPKSEQFKEILSYKEHMILCRFADQTAVQLPSQRRLIGKQCMCLVDLDRARAAEEHGYSVQVISMEPESCSPKNNMIVGVPT